jgi:hypothetical protein
VGGLQQVLGSLQQSAGVYLGDELQESLGADACPAGEQALEVELAQAQAGGYFFEAGLILVAIIKVLYGLLNAQVIFSKLGSVGCVHGNLLFDMSLFYGTRRLRATRFLLNSGNKKGMRPGMP